MSANILSGFSGWRLLVPTLGLLAMLSEPTFANPWSRSLGEARSVQGRTKDIAGRLNREFPYCPATAVALHLDNAACQLVDDAKCGASWGQIQASLARTCALAGQVNDLINAECSLRNDRRLRDYMNDLSKRIERLRRSLDKDYLATQPKFCPPECEVRRPSWGESYPHSTYDFDAAPFERRDVPYGPMPEAVPMARPMEPIEYRVERRVPAREPRAAAFVQLGLQALQLLSEGR